MEAIALYYLIQKLENRKQTAMWLGIVSLLFLFTNVIAGIFLNRDFTFAIIRIFNFYISDILFNLFFIVVTLYSIWAIYRNRKKLVVYTKELKKILKENPTAIIDAEKELAKGQ